jgi:anti-sigma factor RsiW
MIQGYVDGRLPADQVRAVEAHLAQAPADSVRVAAYIDQKRQLRDELQAKFDEPLPARFRVAEIRRMQRRRQTRRIMALAAMITIAIVGATAGWIAAPYLGGNSVDPLVAEALSARDGALRADRTLGEDALASADAGNAVVAATLDVPAKIPDLAKAGYRLAGVSVLHGPGGGPAVQLTYRDAKGGAFTLFMRRSQGSDRFDLSNRGATQICVWQNDALSVVMLGEMPAREMLKVATMTYSALDF